ncbi:MAG: DHH family phosphoesterase [Aliidiomarina sp.]|uniref:DHH family phosphoesterase n=1 Tax=Aliidiomarina sp. TaxID=1872439 RepID=UPI0025BFEF66|nr:DHH family phosphoesterase [Aliidiomarina sp.]MCH8502439.1 DHH family phosphoesterase [Aliidiomarina sp.]
MKYIDVFNGDADGIFSLIQLRKVWPQESRLVTGVKRDNALVRQITSQEADGAHLSILDISFDKNTDELARVLERAESVLYVDHHQAKTLFEHPKLTCRLDYAADKCTGLLLRDYLVDNAVLTEEMRHNLSLWAITAAYGDGLDKVADAQADTLDLSASQRAQLRELGILVNYNGYGAHVTDLHFAPDDLYQRLQRYDSPFAVVADANSPYSRLKAGYDSDLALAEQSDVLIENDTLIAIQLADAPWSRRISGTFGNLLATGNPNKAIVIATQNVAKGGEPATLTISLRAPKNNLQGAGDICASFPTGGGRAGAAGVNALPVANLVKFINQVIEYYSR